MMISVSSAAQIRPLPMMLQPQIPVLERNPAPQKRRKILHHNALLFIDGIYEKAALLLRTLHIYQNGPLRNLPFQGIEPAEINKRHQPVFIQDIIPSVNFTNLSPKGSYSRK